MSEEREAGLPQYGEEEWLKRYFGLPCRGFVVDIGAARPEVGSNSRFLIEEHGWGGIVVAWQDD